jgi:hypothetical protein
MSMAEERASWRFNEWLDVFNNKERYFVFAAISGQQPLRLHDSFRSVLSDRIGVVVPEDACAYVDYHLDWIHAASRLTGRSEPSPFKQVRDASNLEFPWVARGNQEDIDLVVTFQDGDVDTVVLIEAKGSTSWGNLQMTRKATRLGQIFGETGTAVPGVRPFFVLMSPNPSKGLLKSNWPAWMLDGGEPRWMPMAMTQNRLAVTQCNEGGTPTQNGEYWTTRAVK